MPGSQFVSNVAIHPYELKAQGCVEPHTAGIGQGDARVTLRQALQGQERKERGIQGPAHARAPRLGVDIDGDIHGPLIGGPSPVGTGVDIAHDRSVPLADKPRQVLQRLDDPRLHLRLGRWLDFKRDGRLTDDGRVDRQDGRGIVRRGRADCGAHPVLPRLRGPGCPHRGDLGRTVGEGVGSAAWVTSVSLPLSLEPQCIDGQEIRAKKFTCTTPPPPGRRP